MPGRPTNFDNSGARTCSASVGEGGVCGYLSLLIITLSSLPLSGRRIDAAEILCLKAIQHRTTTSNQPTRARTSPRVPEFGSGSLFTRVHIYYP